MTVTSVAEALARAASMIGKRTKYKLGRGGTNPAAGTPADKNGECDCSGFICWCLKMSRRTTHPAYLKFNGGWINTDAMVYDAKNPVGFFSRIAAPAPGALWVYGWHGQPRRPGHVGIIDSVAKSGATIIHCSSGNYRRTGDAIQRTPATLFEKKGNAAILAWFGGFSPPSGISDREIDELFE